MMKKDEHKFRFTGLISINLFALWAQFFALENTLDKYHLRYTPRQKMISFYLSPAGDFPLRGFSTD